MKDALPLFPYPPCVPCSLIRVLTYEEPVAGSREHYQEKIESTLNEWGEEIEKIRKKTGGEAWKGPSPNSKKTDPLL